MTMARSIRPLAVAAILALPLLAWRGEMRHNRLTRSLPSADSTVSAPTEIQLWFSERPEPRLSAIALLASDSSRVALGPVRAGRDTLSVTAAVSAPLKAGQYAVVWRTTSTDGHAVRGRFVFRVRE